MPWSCWLLIFLSAGCEHAIYPDWQSIIPDIENGGYKPYTFDKEKFYKWVDELRIQHKAETGKGIKWANDWLCKVGVHVFSAELFPKFIEAMDYLGTYDVYESDDMRAAVVRSDKGVCILLPAIQPNQFGESNPNHIVL